MAFQSPVICKRHNRLKSSNLIERLNKKVRRRKSEPYFLNMAFVNSLIEVVLMEVHENWISFISSLNRVNETKNKVSYILHRSLD
ncbi:transposase [Marinilactibacillus psychrotolerans]|uniref:Transposase n=2 Tax=Marinilactibacillus psychrotolerans TaxID=191770 RepID=A0ABW8URH7_9LACT